jgi:hypothetical protein
MAINCEWLVFHRFEIEPNETRTLIEPMMMMNNTGVLSILQPTNISPELLTISS